MQRLSGLDASFLYFETRAQLLHVSGLIVLDVSDMKGGYSFEALRRELSRRVTGMPGFRRKLHDSVLNVDHPVWVEADDFDIDHHLHRVGIPAPGGDHELSELCAHLASQPIDRSMPLWQMYVIEGLPGDQVAVFAKMHHSTVDGVTGANMMSQLCTLTPEDPTLDEDLVAETAGGSGALELAVGGALSRLATPWRLASLLPGTLGVLPSWINRARKGLAMPAPFTAPRTPFNRNITGHRSIAFTTLELDDVKRVKNAFGTTINDVVLAVCASALRAYLDAAGDLPDKPLIAMVPMSVHDADHRPGTNRVSGMFMSLATDVDDPVERLELIRDHNTVAKEHNKAIDANLLTDWAQFAAPSVFGSAVRMYSRLRLSERHPVVYNLVISNVPGPNFPLYFLGCRIENMLPMGPVFHGAGLNCTVMSLDGELHVGFIACRDLIADLWPLAELIPEALQEYLRVVEEREADDGATASKATARKKAPAAKATARKKAPAAKATPAKTTTARTTSKAAAKKSTTARTTTAAKTTTAATKTTPAKKSTSAKKSTPATKTTSATKTGATKTGAKAAGTTEAAATTARTTRKPRSAKPVGTAPMASRPAPAVRAASETDRDGVATPSAGTDGAGTVDHPRSPDARVPDTRDA